MSVPRTCNEWPLAYLTKHKNFATMKTTIDFSVIDQMFAAIMAANENDATIDALRPQVEQAVRELIRQRGLPRTFTGIIEYNGFHIRVQRPKSYTWHLNTQIQDDDLEYYKRLRDLLASLSGFILCMQPQRRDVHSVAPSYSGCTQGDVTIPCR